MYYKNKENQPYYEPSQSIIERDGLVEITEEEFNKIVYEINNPPITEEQRVSSINTKAGEIIEAKYPIYKQLNITNLLTPYTEQDREEAKAFIDAIIKISNDSIDNGITLENIDWGI